MFFGEQLWAGIGCWIFVADVQRHDLQPFYACESITLAQHNALEPAGKSLRFAKLIELLPGQNKRFLSNVFSKISIAEHRKRTGKSHVLKTNYQFGKRLMAQRQRAA